MRAFDCESIRDLLPEWAAGRLDAADAAAVRTHLGRCGACAEEAALLRTLGRHRLEAPAGLERRILHAADRARARRRVVRPLGAAAVIALTWFGAGVLLLDDAAAPRPTAAVDGEPIGGPVRPFSGWPGTDGLLAGALMVDALTDEELELLLAELET